jgi:hypothetical protein
LDEVFVRAKSLDFWLKFWFAVLSADYSSSFILIGAALPGPISGSQQR